MNKKIKKALTNAKKFIHNPKNFRNVSKMQDYLDGMKNFMESFFIFEDGICKGWNYKTIDFFNEVANE